MLSFRTARVAQDPTTSDSRRALLRDPNGHVQLLCETLVAAYSSRKVPDRRSDSERGYPWISLVLGSGCVERLHLVPDDTEGLPHRFLPHLVQKALAHIDRPIDEKLYEGDRGALGYDFVASLLRDRLDEDPAEPVSHKEGRTAVAEVAERTAALCLLAAILTRLYYESKVAGTSAPVTRGEDRVELSAPEHPVRYYRDEISSLRAEIRDSLGEDDTALDALLNRIAAELGDNRLALLDVQLLTEIAWYHLTRDLDAYPGWSDMLSELAIRREIPLDRYADRYGPRPLYDTFVGLAIYLAELFERATAKSWELVHGSRSSTSGDRGDLHAAAARLLSRQAQLYAAAKAVKPPPPSAFVTTFDIELEMALWNRGTPFVVALPVHVQVEGVNEVLSCWLGRVVKPFEGDIDEELDALRGQGAVEDWVILSTADNWSSTLATVTGDRIGKKPYPVVVRLSGSPLMAPPVLGKKEFAPLQLKLQDYLKSYLMGITGQPDTDDEQWRENLRVHAAVIVDEYASLRQSLSELYESPEKPGGGKGQRQGLPTALTEGSNSDFARYWMLLGVQLGDPGMRQRFSSQLLSPLLTGGSQSLLNPAGLAVAKRSDDVLARDLVRWHGFNLVRAKCEEFTDDLLHYVDHLDLQHPATGFPRVDERCDLSAQSISDQGGA